MKLFSTVTKTAMALSLGALMMTSACNQEELASTKDQLAKTASERDQLKGQLTTAQAENAALKKELDDTKAKLGAGAPAPAVPAAPAAPEPAAKGTPAHHAGKGAAAKAGAAPVAPTAPPPDTTKPVGSAENPVAAPSRGSRF